MIHSDYPQISLCANVEKSCSTPCAQINYFKDVYHITIPGKSMDGRPVQPLNNYLQVEETFQENEKYPIETTNTIVKESVAKQTPNWFHANQTL